MERTRFHHGLVDDGKEVTKELKINIYIVELLH